MATRSSGAASRPACVVGVGNNSDAYTATRTAIDASGQFPSANMGGKTVIIKPNLVTDAPSTSGITTDPQVVRAIVDLALDAGAAQILIAEGSCVAPAPFDVCGYSFFQTYDPQGRISLVDLSLQTTALVQVPNSGGMVYQSLWLPQVVTDPDAIFISAAKLKTHCFSGATLALKNLIGLAPYSIYNTQGQLRRQDMHYRGIAESVIDVNRARPVHFAVIDGIWGMEGQGPSAGTAVATNLVFAGVNPAAVDLVALDAIQIEQYTVPYLYYAAVSGMGPRHASDVVVKGDTYSPVPYTPAVTPPVMWHPIAGPNILPSGSSTSISYKIPQACETSVEIIQDSDDVPGVTVVKTLQDWISQPAETATVNWGGTNGQGSGLAPGVYLARVQARFTSTGRTSYTSTILTVTD